MPHAACCFTNTQAMRRWSSKLTCRFLFGPSVQGSRPVHAGPAADLSAGPASYSTTRSYSPRLFFFSPSQIMASQVGGLFSCLGPGFCRSGQLLRSYVLQSCNQTMRHRVVYTTSVRPGNLVKTGSQTIRKTGRQDAAAVTNAVRLNTQPRS